MGSWGLKVGVAAELCASLSTGHTTGGNHDKITVAIVINLSCAPHP